MDYEQKSAVFCVRRKVIPSGSIVHIIQRAPGDEVLFRGDEDYLYFLKLLKEVSHKQHIDVLCFCLMPNHFHLLVRFNEENASEAIKNLCERYAWFFNTKYKRKGHVFYGRFRSSICLDETYFITASLYIHANPVKAGLSKTPWGYRWSSYSLFWEKVSRRTFVECGFILGFFDSSLGKAKKGYRELMAIYLQKIGKEFGVSPKVLLSIRARLGDSIYRVRRMNPSKGSMVTDDSLWEQIEKLKGRKDRRSKEYKQLRVDIVALLISRGFSFEEIAQFLSIDIRTVYRVKRYNRT